MKNWSFKKKNREPQYAGQFYPADKLELDQELKQLFKCASVHDDKKETQKGKLQAIISPHAGYIFSGKVAAKAYQQIPEDANYKRVFVLASSHRYSFKGAAIFSDGNYNTPLGEIKIDDLVSKKLTKNSDYFIKHNDAHNFEHSLEVQLPFLQYQLGNHFLLVPIILGTQDPAICKKIAETLKSYFTSENLFVISTDFSHFPNYEDANEIDNLTATAICENNPEQLLSIISDNKKQQINNLETSLCGWTSVLTLLHLTEKKNFSFEKLMYQNSGDSEIYGEKNRVVGYWAISIHHPFSAFQITESEKKELLDKTRNSIKSFLQTGKKGKIIDAKSKGILNDITGVFVSVYIKNKLRGCIGNFADEKNLNELAQKMAVSAVCDNRFKSVQFGELEDMELEISVLSPLKRIKSKDEIELGKHGIYIKHGLNSGTFLPQVAIKTKWNINEFLGHCSRDKAGLGWEGWKTAELYTYEAIIFKA